MSKRGYFSRSSVAVWLPVQHFGGHVEETAKGNYSCPEVPCRIEDVASVP